MSSFLQGRWIVEYHSAEDIKAKRIEIFLVLETTGR